MIAGLNSVRVHLNARARMRLRAAGTLGTEAVMVGDTEFRIGDWVVARQNNRQLRGDGNTLVKKGSTGTVVAVNGEEHSVCVQFECEGVMVLPSWYIQNNYLDHAYARTTYGVQGRTVEHASYQSNDASLFEEGYVAITRATSGTRIYLVDSEVTESRAPSCGNDFVSSGSDCQKAVPALERRRAKLTALANLSA